MPVVAALMDKLTGRYGKDRGEKVYYAMEASARGPFAKGAKHYADHVAFAERNGVAPIVKAKRAPARKREPVKAKVRRPGPRRSAGR